MSGSRPVLRPADLFVVVPSLAAVLAAFFLVFSGGGGRPLVNVRGDGGRWIFPADAYLTEFVSGPLGYTVIEVRPGAARVASSPCADQVCVASGEVRRAGQWSACLPNRVMLYLTGGAAGAGGDVDATVR